MAALLLVLGVAALAATLALAREPNGDAIERLVDDVVDAGAPGVLLFVRDGGTSRVVVRGAADGTQSRQIAAGDRFRIGSVTKTFVATVVLQLVAERRLALDDPVGTWLPGVLSDGDRITVRQLLQHTSGLFDYVEDERVFAAYATNPRHGWTPHELIEIGASHEPLFSPGRRFAYSSTNYLALGLLVEAVSGRPLELELRRRILEPLGLASTSFDPGLVEGSYIHGHRPPSHGGVVTGPPRDTSREAASWSWAAGAMVSSADDLVRFFEALLGGKLVPTAELAEMKALVSAGAIRYGLGLATFQTPCGDAWGHTGNAQGTITVAWNREDLSRQMVLVVNAYPLTPAQDTAVRRLQDGAFCAAD